MKERRFKTMSGVDAFLAAQRARGNLTWHMMVLHDDRCSTTECRCSPWYVLRPLTEEAVADGAARQAQWVKETVS